MYLMRDVCVHSADDAHPLDDRQPPRSAPRFMKDARTDTREMTALPM